MSMIATQPDSSKAAVHAAPPMHPSDLISRLLKEQSALTAVDEFSSWHQTHTEPEQAMYYRNLLPTAMPQAGQQLAFEVNLDKCSGCKACVVACHSLNGLDEGESFRDVGLLLGSADSGSAFQHVTTACHHCIDPGCLNACPVNAYEKDPMTGIVRHLDDQCFGCQYCTLACPYEVPKYHAAKGIVRKCDMCTQRLATGEAPACVQACPHQAISITTIDITVARADAIAAKFLPDAPHPEITIPTTRFTGKAASNPQLRGGTYSSRPLEHAHWPLILLLVLSQIAVGIVCVMFVLNSNMWSGQRLTSRPAPEWIVSKGGGTALALFAGPTLRSGLLGLAAILAAFSAMSSTLHLGRPQFAYRAILGIRHSWLSREIAAFGAFIPLCFLSAALSWADSAWLNLSLVAAALSGIAGVTASAMIYHVTRRPFWSVSRSVPSFISSSLGLGSLICLWALQLSAIGAGTTTCRMLACAAAFSAVVKLCLLGKALLWKQATAPNADSEPGSPLHSSLIETSQLLSATLMSSARLQTVCGITTLLITVCLILRPIGPHAGFVAGIAVITAVAAEVTERFLFFRAVVPLRMPGVVRS